MLVGLRRLLRLNRGAVVVTAAVVVLLRSWMARRDARRRSEMAKRIAVVGSGIAGAGAAWSLHRAGKDVVVFEKKPKVGGNAKAMQWDVNGMKVETGLAVLAWPEQYFHNYNCLIEELGIETEEHEMKFFVAERDEATGQVERVFAHGEEPDVALQEDLSKWARLYQFVKRMNAVFQPCDRPSLYRVGFFNPLNLIPLRTLCRLYGISDRFWHKVFVPVHTSTFLEVEMDTIPALMAELLEEIVPFTKIPKMRTWKTHAQDTVKKMLSELPHDNVKTSCGVESVQYIPREDGNGFIVRVRDEDDVETDFDGIVFACSAQAMNRILHGKGLGVGGRQLIANGANGFNNNTSLSGFASWFFNSLETTLLSNTLYTTDRDLTFERGSAHSDADAIFPPQFKDEILNSYCNYIEVNSKKPKRLENSFVLSSWAPTTQLPEVKGKLPMVVTYNADKKLENVDVQWVSTSREGHPCLTMLQLASSVAFWPLLQGQRAGQTFFCGSAVLPANGHDLSFVSGLAVAERFGAPYPFPGHLEAKDDLNKLNTIMFRFGF